MVVSTAFIPACHGPEKVKKIRHANTDLPSSIVEVYRNLTPYGSILWIRMKRHVIHHWLCSLCTEDTWKALQEFIAMEDW